MLNKSIFILCTSICTFPKAWAASVWKNTSFYLQISDIACKSCTTPISLFKAIIDTSKVFSDIKDFR